MALMAPTGSQFENPEPGSYIARCYGFIDIGTQLHKSKHAGKEDWLQRDVRFLFELPLNKMEGVYNKEAAGKPFVVSTTIKFSLAPSAKMFKMITGWRGKALTKDEAKTFIVKKMIGAPCRISLIEADDFINIDSFSKLTKEEVASCPPMINEPIYFSLDPEEFDKKSMEELSDKTKERIALSPEYRALMTVAKPAAEPVDAPFSPSGAPTGSSAGGTPRTEAEAANLVSRPGTKPANEVDEDVPF